MICEKEISQGSIQETRKINITKLLMVNGIDVSVSHRLIGIIFIVLRHGSNEELRRINIVARSGFSRAHCSH